MEVEWLVNLIWQNEKLWEVCLTVEKALITGGWEMLQVYK
jgi:hypothetical protein